jgi:hypothetical protein
MLRSPLLAIAGSLILTSTTLAAAKAPGTWASGQIERYDASASSVVVKQGTHEMTFVLAPDARLTVGSKTMPASDLANDVGRHVKIRYIVKDGSKVADRLEIATAAAKTTSKK